VNTAAIPSGLRKKYAGAHVKPVENDFEALTEMGVKVVTADLVCGTSVVRNKIRHDPAALANVVVDLASRSRAFQIRQEELAARKQRSK
jgi:intracellular sulfur oxidation DsrE/DsrF family protein